MKITSFRNKESKFSADLWTFVNTTDASGGNVKTYSFNRTIYFNAVTGNFGKIDVFFQDSEHDVRAFCQLQNFKGPDGNEMMDKGVFQVEMISPFINTWGHREGFRARIAFFGLLG
jgi:hypothetical protein